MATVPVYNPWAIILCKWKDDSSEPFPVWYYQNLFSTPGMGLNNQVDFFRLYSHGNIDMSGSQVFGWFVLSHSRSEYTGSGANPDGRQQLIGWATSAASSNGVDLGKFFGVVVCMNDSTDLFGDLGTPAVVCDSNTAHQSPLGQEMLHGYGVNHARLNGSTTDYTDPFDVMSVFNASMAPDQHFGQIGPGLNAAIMDSKGWLDPERVWTYPGGDAEVDLRPHHRRDLPGFLVAKVGSFYVEFRMNEGFDAGLLVPVVLVHRFDEQDGHSYLMPSTDSGEGLVAGSKFVTSPGPQQVTVTVTKIDAANRMASMTVTVPAATVLVPDISGMTLAGAERTVGAVGLVLAPVGTGFVVSQSPRAGTHVAPASVVHAHLSTNA